MANKILIIATAFAPENEIGAVRLSKLAKYLIRFGFNVTVLSPKLHEQSKIDNNMEEVEFAKITRVQISQSTYFNIFFLRRRNSLLEKGSANSYLKVSSKDSAVRAVKVHFFKIIHLLYSLLRNYDWSRKVNSYSKINFKQNDFDIVFSSYPSLGAHWAAFNIKKRKIASLWIADFRDPINYSTKSIPLQYYINSQIQKRIVKRADIVTYISNDLLIKFPGEFHHKFHLLVNGFDEDDRKFLVQKDNNLDDKKIRLCYVGSLYGGQRKLDVVFRALRELMDENFIEAQSIEFVYAGKEYQVLYQQALKHGLSSCLLNKGSVSRKESLSIQLASDLIVVATWNTEQDQGIITGKLFEGFLTKRNLLGVVNGTVPNSEFKRIIEEVEGGFVIEEASSTFDNDFQNLKKHLAGLYKIKVDKGFVESTYNDKIVHYSYRSITDRLVKLFN